MNLPPRVKYLGPVIMYTLRGKQLFLDERTYNSHIEAFGSLAAAEEFFKKEPTKK